VTVCCCERVKRYDISVYRRDTSARTVYDALADLEEP
jgi:hypothetical protein